MIALLRIAKEKGKRQKVKASLQTLLPLLFFLFPLAQPPDPQFLASWDAPGQATVSWTQQQRGCLYVTHQSGAQAFVGCWEGSGRVKVELGHQGPMDAAVRPTAGDVYIASIDGVTERAPLRWWRWLAVWRA